MLLAIDIGNSLVKFGVFDGDKLFDKFSIATKRDYRSEELHFDRLKFAGDKLLKVVTVMVSTVVPELIDVVREASRSQFKVTPTFVDHNANFGIENKYDPPTAVGIDRLVNASAAVEKYGTPVIIYRRDITNRGWPMDKTILAQLRAGQLAAQPSTFSIASQQGSMQSGGGL